MTKIERPDGISDADWILFEAQHGCIEENHTDLATKVSGLRRLNITIIASIVTMAVALSGSVWKVMTYVGSIDQSIKTQTVLIAQVADQRTEIDGLALQQAKNAQKLDDISTALGGPQGVPKGRGR